MSGSSSIVSHGFTTQFDGQIAVAAAANGIDPQFLHDQLAQESGLSNTPSGGNGGGIGQFISGTASTYGVDAGDAESGINGAAAYDANLLKQTGSYSGVLARYGTVPASAQASGNLAPGQQTVLDDANALDGSGATYPSVTAAATADPSTPYLSTTNGTTTTPSAQTIAQGQAIVASQSGGLQSYIVRFVAVLVGVIFVGVGLTFLKPGLMTSATRSVVA